MKKITVTFRCSCGFIKTADVIDLKFVGQLINDFIQFGKIYLMAKEHSKEFHSKKLDFGLISFVLNQRAQRKIKQKQIANLKKSLIENTINNTSPELTELLQKFQQAEQQRIRYEEWKKYFDNSKAG